MLLSLQHMTYFGTLSPPLQMAAASTDAGDATGSVDDRVEGQGRNGRRALDSPGVSGLPQALEQKTGISHFKGRNDQNLAVWGHRQGDSCDNDEFCLGRRGNPSAQIPLTAEKIL